MAQRPQPSLRLADGGSFITRWAQSVMRPNATTNRLREVDAPPPAPASAPVRAPAPPPPNPNATPDNPAGIRFQDGGMVPGTGRGDKIPAKYEPGEFVVSNDMIDDNPGLREQLSGLRANTLAARGKTVEEADAKALNGGRRPSLRAVDGFDPLDRMAKGLTGQNSLPPRSPVGNMADDLARNARAAVPEGPAVRPTTPLPPDAAAAYDASPEGRASKAQVLKESRGYFQGSPNTAPAAAPANTAAASPSTASKWFGAADDWKGMVGSQAGSLKLAPPEAPGRIAKGFGALQGAAGAYNAYQGVQEGDAWKTGVGAADAVAGAALFTPAAPAAGAYLGLRGAWDGAKMAGGAIYDNLSEKARDVVGGTVNQIGLNTGLWGEDDSTKMQMDAAAPKPADTLRKTAPGAAPDPRDPYAAANAAKIAASDAQNKAAAAPNPGAAQRPEDSADVGRVIRNGNEYSGVNVGGGGNITINGFAPGAGLNLGSGPNAQNMTAADALAGTQQRESMARVRAGGQSAAGPTPTTLRQQAMDMLASRELGSRKTARAMLDAANSMEQNVNTRYSSDSSLRGTMYTADSQLGGKQMEMQRRLREQQLTGMLWRESGGDPSKFQSLAMQYGLADTAKLGSDTASASQTRDHNATTNARKRLEGMAVRDDGKGGTVVDPGRLARLESTLGKMAPGWQHMSEPEQAKHLATAEAGVNLLEGLNDRRNNSFWQSIGVDGASASLDNLPIEAMKGGRLKTVKALEGAFTGGGVERNDYVIGTKDGRKLYLPRDKVNQGELELLKSRGVDISSLQK